MPELESEGFKWPIRLPDVPPPSFKHTYYRDLTGDNPQPATVVCEPSLYLPRNHIDCVVRHCHRPLRYENHPQITTDLEPSPFSPSLKALIETLPNGITFVANGDHVRPLKNALLCCLATPQEAYNRAGVDRLSQNLYDVFMARWNKALWEHDEACFDWGRIDGIGLHAAAKFQACRLANFYLSFKPHFTKEAWKKMEDGRGRTWETSPRICADGEAPDLVLDGIAVLTTSLGCMVSDDDMCTAIIATSSEPDHPRARFDTVTGTVSWQDTWVEDRLKKVWLEIFRLFHLYRVRYVLAYNGLSVQLYYLNQTNEVFVSSPVHASVAEKFPNCSLLTLLIGLAVVPEPTRDDEDIFISLEPKSSSPTDCS